MSEEFFGIGTISESAPRRFQYDVLTEFDFETYERFSQAIGNALAPLNNFNIELVEKNFQCFLGVQKFANRIFTLSSRIADRDRVKLAESVMGQIVNWLTAYRFFLDHAEFQLKRKYGKKSPQLQRFQRQTASAFDNAKGYRFVYKFRNYVQHCAAPLSAVTVGRPEVDAPDGTRRVVFSLNRDQLLQDYEWGTKVRPDLEQMDESFELEPLAQEAMTEIREINHILEDIAVEEGARTIADVREALNLIPASASGVPNLFRSLSNDDGRVLLSPQPFPSEETVEKYEAVLSGSMQPSDLRSREYSQDPPPYDPDTIRTRFHHDNRAVQLMTLWQAEGGSSEFLIDRINENIRVDGGVSPTISGFLNMTAVLLHMTAAAIGIAPEGLIGSLLDSYPSGASDDSPVN